MKVLKDANGTILLVLFIMISSCKRDDFLNKYPLDAFTEPTFFKTEVDLKTYANSFYDQLPAVWDYSVDNNSDNMVPRTINSFLAGKYVVPSSGGGWSSSDWAGIRSANYFLQHYKQADIAKDIKDKYAAEVKFFRALFYWQKVKRFGDVPLVLAALTDTNKVALYGPRMDRKIVMDTVLSDINYAVKFLPEKGEADAGRLNKDVALALKSRVFLWAGTYREYHKLGNYKEFLQEAVNASSDLMESGHYSLYSTGHPNEDYRNLFIQRDLSNNSEAIFYEKAVTDVNTPNRYTRTATENNTGASKDFVDAYLFTDGNPIGRTSFQYSDNTPEKEFANRDPRLAQTIAGPGFVWQYDQDPADSLKQELPPVGTAKTSTGYWFIKGRSSDREQYVLVYSDIDAFVFRYAEILLNYAEAQYELEGKLTQDELDESINKIRDRVGMPHLTPNPVLDPNAVDYGYPVSPLLYEIRRERRIELVGEGFRFDDIRRWKAGKLIDNVKTILGMKFTDAFRSHYDYDVSSVTVNTDKYITMYSDFTNGRKWDDKMYLYPIPIDQITLAGYDQNDGW